MVTFRRLFSTPARGRSTSAGFTLIEVMLVVGIIGVLFTLTPQIFIQINRFITVSQTKMDLQREARATLSIMNRSLRQAAISSVLVDRASSTQPYCSRISFTRVDGVGLTFFQDNTRLVMITRHPGLPAATKTISENLRYLAFVPPRSEDLSIISVSLTLEKAIQEGRAKSLHMASEKVMVMNE